MASNNPFSFFSQEQKLGKLGMGGDAGSLRSLALLNALGPMSQEGMIQHPTKGGAIAGSLLPIFAALIQGKALEAQAGMQQQKTALEMEELQARIAKAKMGQQPKQPTSLDALAVQRLQKGEPTQDIVDLKRAMQKPAAPTETSLLMGKLAGDPTATAGYDALEAQKDARSQQHANTMVDQSERIKTARDEADLRKMQQMPASENPRYSSQVIFERDTAKRANPASGLIDMPGSPYVAIPRNDARVVTGAKQINQQLGELEKLVPEILPESRMGFGQANTLKDVILGGEAGGKIARFKTLAELQKMTGIKDFVAGGRSPSQRELENIGGISPYWDTQSTAMEKINAWRSVMTKTLNSYDLNGDVILGKSATTKAPAEAPAGKPFAGEIPVDKQGEFEALMKGLAARHASQAEAEEAARRYMEANQLR